jgi:AraC-like DNA-binding protein
MIYRIFDQVLAGHIWSDAGRLQVVQGAPDRQGLPASPDVESRSHRARLVIRSKGDRVMCRAARRLLANPSMPLDRLASELGVSERYLVSGLRAVLGVSPKLLSAKRRV